MMFQVIKWLIKHYKLRCYFDISVLLGLWCVLIKILIHKLRCVQVQVEFPLNRKIVAQITRKRFD